MKTDIQRFVTMTFDPTKMQDFLAIFEDSSDRIREQDGCLHLELLADLRHPNVMMTYSIWASENSLEAYRKSVLFKDTWAKTRVLFAAKPVATSFRRVATSKV